MLPFPHRIPHTGIPVVLRTGRHFRSCDMEIIYLPNQCSLPRFSISVASSRVKLAVHRNRIKRIFTEAIRKRIPDVGNYDVFIRIFRDLFDRSVLDAGHLFDESAGKAGLKKSV